MHKSTHTLKIAREKSVRPLFPRSGPKGALQKRGLTLFSRSSLTDSRRGSTVVELLVAIALLGFAVVAIGRFTNQVNHGLRDRELSARIDWELQNARERIGAWRVGEITEERIGQHPVSESLAKWLEDAKFVGRVEQIESPAQATQVTLALECQLNGQAAAPAIVTFWVLPKSEGEE